jgi:class 3 adenylate cyclase
MSLPTGTVTFLFTDIEGSTRLWDRYPETMRQALARHDALMKEAIEKHHGHVFKTIGDAFCAAFATASDAVMAAVAAQKALENLQLTDDKTEESLPLRVRMALNTGTAEERDGDYFGPTLNKVARLLAAGHGGQILLTASAEAVVAGQLPDSISLVDMGSQRLKDLQLPEHVHQLRHPDLQAEFPPLRALNASNNLPIQVTSFVGREREIAEVKRLFEKTRLLTLTGSGGAGKTRLSLQVAAEMMEQNPDGVWLVELAPLSDPNLVPQTVATVLNVREEPGRPITQTLVDFLKTRSLLLLLDNCEHLLTACANLADTILRNCPKAYILASSREGLNIPGETTYRIPSLSLPDTRETLTPENLMQYEAVQLFVERAQSAQPSFVVTPQNAAAVGQLCVRLDGIPLAIELAAARVKAMSVEQIASRLDDRFRLLTGGSRTALPRQQTLRALIDWSYDLLSEQEQTLLRRLSVFAGGWTLEAAEKVCSDRTDS